MAAPRIPDKRSGVSISTFHCGTASFRATRMPISARTNPRPPFVDRATHIIARRITRPVAWQATVDEAIPERTTRNGVLTSTAPLLTGLVAST